jgi:putative transposase
MSAQRFSTGKQFVWQDSVYEVKRLLTGNLLTIENVQTTERQSVPFSALAEALFAGELHFVAESRTASAARPGQQATLADYPSHLRALANYRLEVIRPLLALGPTKRTRAQVAARVTEIKQARQAGAVSPTAAISIPSIYRWIKAYERSGHDIRALVGNSEQQGGKDQSRLAEEAEAILNTVIQDRYYVAEKVTCDDIYLEVALRIAEENRLRHAGEQLTPPSRTTVWRRIDALDELGKLIAKRGKRSAKRRLTQYGKLDYPHVPLERVEIDHTPMDVIVVDAQDNLPLGRPTLTYCLDTTTRYPLGFYVGFEPPSYLTVMECLHHAMLTKPQVRATYGTQHDWIAYGIPFALIVDNGKEFIGTDIHDACYSLGIELLHMPIKTPHFKASVERMFRTLNTGLLHTLPGTTFSNPQQRGAYDSAAEACIDLDDLYRVLHIFLVDVYAESFHRGLGDIPARRWEAITQAGFFPRLPTSADELKILLGRMTHRVIQPYGIEFLRLRYNTPDLAPLRTYLEGAKAKIKYDPTDLGRIHVYDPRDQTYIPVRCLDSDYAQGLSLWKHRVILKLARKQEAQVDILGLARAKRQIQEIVAQSKADKKIKQRARIARWQTGEPTTDHTPPAPETTDPPAQTALPAPGLDFSVTLDDLEDEEWSADYDLPHSSCSDGLR